MSDHRSMYDRGMSTSSHSGMGSTSPVARLHQPLNGDRVYEIFQPPVAVTATSPYHDVPSASSSRLPPVPAAVSARAAYDRVYDEYDSGHRSGSGSGAGPAPARDRGGAYDDGRVNGYANGHAYRGLQSRSPTRDPYPGRHSLWSRSAPSLSPTKPDTPSIRVVRPNDRLLGNEDIWEHGLKRYQARREREVDEIARWANEHDLGGDAAEPTDDTPAKGKAKGEKRKYTRKTKAARAAAIDDELLGLVGEEAPSSPVPSGLGLADPRSDAIEADPEADEEEDGDPFDPDAIVRPCGLTRAEVIRKIESNDISGLTEDDVKAVQDEMWLREKGREGGTGAPVNKDGTVRKKPGPAKGWKRIRGIESKRGRKSTAVDEGSEADTSIAGDTVNGDPDADIAALLEEPAKKPKVRRKRKQEEDKIVDVSEEEDHKPSDAVEEEQVSRAGSPGGSSAIVEAPPGPKKRSKAKEPGVGKGKWTRAKPDAQPKEPKKDKEADKVEEEEIEEDMVNSNALSDLPYAEVVEEKPPGPGPNSYDPRGVSEAEAQVRYGLVEELQKQVWSTVVRDVPKSVTRKAQAAVRNGHGQKNLKFVQKSGNRVNKDAVSKAKRIVKEDELIARKKAEKEALEKAKAEEEARESKRQARKLNFLLTQTELYSHFIGKKIKTSEAERPDSDTAAAGPVEPPHPNEDLGLGDDGELLPDLDYDDVDGDELNFQNPSLGEDSITITQPKMLMAQLKEYQLKGLTWLGNLYEQGINGILADEMGLGKTIQSISLLAYLAEHHNLWGPFLVIAPSSTLHNWQQELARFVPRLKALPYWGSPKDRETLRRIWSRKNQTFSEQSPFHILVTSYQLYLQGMKWQYMILDEAQAIKSSSSARWKSLLSLHCRNRLLLTGTPIQNSMHEFSEWFSRDIENAAGGQAGSLKPEQLRRLHMILKPFMLRRVKKHVQKELGDKRVSIADLIAQANNVTDTSGAKNLMNLVMQFRKVCNHPDLFERADVVSPFVFGTFSQSGNLAREGDNLYIPDSAKNAIEVTLPKMLWAEKLDVPSEHGVAGSDTHILNNLMNIWSADWIRQSSDFGFAKLLDTSPGRLARDAKSHPLVSLLNESDGSRRKVVDGPYRGEPEFSAHKAFTLAPRVPHASAPGGVPLREIATRTWNQSFLSRPDARFATDYAIAPLIKPVASDRAFLNAQERSLHDPLVHEAMYGLAPSEVHDPDAYARLQAKLPNVPAEGLFVSAPVEQTPLSSLRVPPTKRLIVDSAKLARLDDLLRELKDGGHRVLLYFQMTKMMDLVEEYLIFRQYKYLRLDGSSAIGDRRDMVTSWQTNTRAGGLGINLTAADTVIFWRRRTSRISSWAPSRSRTWRNRPRSLPLFMDDEELAESVAKRKQAEAHGYVAPTITRQKSTFGDGLGRGDDDEDDFFRVTNKGTGNNEDEDFGEEDKAADPAAEPTPAKKSAKRKAPEGGKKPQKKKVKIALGPDGLPI
ncbi:hypothetical protein IAU60_003191 [Kwoniella sp. DSM 27419]